MKAEYFFISLTLFFTSALKAQPNWPSIKDTVSPEVMIPSEYDAPYRLAGSLGWEDGQYITRDGLTIYCFYSPLDLMNFAYPPCGFDCNSVCNVDPYRRGPFQEILDSIPPVLEGVCTEFLSSDILMSHRNSIQDTFPPLVPIHLQIPAAFEGAPSVILNASNPSQIDFFVFALLQPDPTLSNDNSNNIYWIKNTTLDPIGTYTALPSPVNTDSTDEDNPFLERISANDFVLFFSSTNRPSFVGETDIYFSTSNDAGNTWSQPQLVNFNTPFFEDMPHIWQDSIGDYWIYYMNNNLDIARRKQQISGNWANWGPPITVIGKGNSLGIGEPTLTQRGDIVFGLIYDAGTGWGTDTTDRYDDDFWILPRKGSILTAVTDEKNDLHSRIKTYPNPANDFVTIDNSTNEKISIQLINPLGRIFETVETTEKIYTLSLRNLAAGLYLIQITTKKGNLVVKKLVKN